MTKPANPGLRPAERRFYKLKKTAPFTGSGLKLNLRLDPIYTERGDNTYLDGVDGGLFMELVPQRDGLNEAGNPTLDHESEKKIAFALGVPDVAGMLDTLEQIRRHERPVPPEYRKGRKFEEKLAASPQTFVAFHQTGKGKNTVLNWFFNGPQFGGTGARNSLVQLSTSDGRKQQIRLEAWEEVVFVDYLHHALRFFNLYGY